LRRGNAAEICSNIHVSGVKCSARTNVLIAIGAISALLVIVALVLRALGVASFFHAEFILLIVSGLFWVTAAGIVSSPKSSVAVAQNPLATDGDTGIGEFFSTAPFYASWICLLLIVALVGDAVARGTLPTIPARPPAQADPSPPAKPAVVPTDNDPTALAGDAGDGLV